MCLLTVWYIIIGIISLCNDTMILLLLTISFAFFLGIIGFIRILYFYYNKYQNNKYHNKIYKKYYKGNEKIEIRCV